MQEDLPSVFILVAVADLDVPAIPYADRLVVLRMRPANDGAYDQIITEPDFRLSSWLASDRPWLIYTKGFLPNAS